MPAEGHVRPSQVPGARRTSSIDLADRLIANAKAIAESSGTVTQDGGPDDEYGTRPRDLIAGDVASAAGQQRVRLGLPAKTAAEISPKIAAVASNPAAISSIIPKGEPGLDYIPGQGRDGAQSTMVDSGIRNVDAAKNLKPDMSYEHAQAAAKRNSIRTAAVGAEIDRHKGVLAGFQAKIDAHNKTRVASNQKPHGEAQALVHLGLAKAHGKALAEHVSNVNAINEQHSGPINLGHGPSCSECSQTQ